MVVGRILFGTWLAAVGISLTALHRVDVPETHLAIAPIAPAGHADAEVAVRRDRGHGVKRIERAADGLFYLDGEVNGTPVRFLIDSGATAIVLAPADAERAGIDVQGSGRPAAMRTTAGMTDMRWATAHHVSIAGLALRDAEVAVPGDGLQISLLGQNALSRIGPVTFDGDVVTLGRRAEAPPPR